SHESRQPRSWLIFDVRQSSDMEYEFIIDRFCGPAMLAGRITRGDLTVGNTFTTLIERVARKEVQANGDFQFVSEEVATRPVCLKIVAIEAYSRAFET